MADVLDDVMVLVNELRVERDHYASLLATMGEALNGWRPSQVTRKELDALPERLNVLMAHKNAQMDEMTKTVDGLKSSLERRVKLARSKVYRGTRRKKRHG